MKKFMQDEDGHWYRIPEELITEFNMLLYDEDDSGIECWERDEWNKFNDMRSGDDPISILEEELKQLM